MTNCCGLIIIANLCTEEDHASVPTLTPQTLTNKEEVGGGTKKKDWNPFCAVKNKKRKEKKETQKVEEKIKRSPGGNCNKLNRRMRFKVFFPPDNKT